MSVKRNKKPFWKRFLSFCAVALLVFYVGYQGYRSLFSGVETEMAVVHSVYESIETKGMVFRTETLIPAVSGGEAYYSIENGTRVAKGSVIASVYNDATQGRINDQIREIDEQIAVLQTIQTDGSSERVTLDVINNQLNNTIYGVISGTESGVLTGLDNAAFDLLSLLSKKHLITGNTLDFTQKIAQLKEEKARLKKNYTKAKSVVRAPVAGYFAAHTDGFEETVKTNGLANMTVEDMQKHLEMQPTDQQTTGGKIVSGYEWYVGCVVPDSYYGHLSVGSSLTLRMALVLDEQIPVTVYACNKDNNGNLAVVFRSDYMSAELSTIRQESVEIQLVKHTGLKVPKRAIVMNDEQQAGVFVRSGNSAAFRLIEQQYSEPADYVICEEINQSGYLQLYDDVIVGGKGLYDGKIIR
ncbi:MAG: hypothetical protein II363_05665 [Clostridia bacterium]|nr:hypothetical protein [Clostridia bacterium]